MYCPNCGSKNDDAARFCTNCGTSLATRSGATGDVAPAPSVEQLKEAGRGATILTLGILSVVLLGLIVGIPAWVMGNKDLRKIKAGTIDAKQRGLTVAGMILGIIGTFHVIAGILVVLLVVGATIGTARVASRGQPEALAATSPSYAENARRLAYYDDIEQIRGQTTDDPPAIYLLQVSLGYDPKDSGVSVEIGNRRREIQDIILRHHNPRRGRRISLKLTTASYRPNFRIASTR
jgi:flagellar basal body-associated protein FliL